MALPGNQTDRGPIIRNSGNCSMMDLNLNASGSTWPLNILGMGTSGHHYDNRAVFLPPPNTQSAGNKEMIKHAMLKQEAEFRAQINELHQIYKRQVEFMNERKEDEYKRKMQAQSLHASSVMFQDSIEHALKQWGTPNNLPGLTHSQNHVAAPYSAQIMGSSKDSSFLAANSKCRKIGNIILDLQLPGEVYADFEEEKSLPTRNVSKQPAIETYRGSTSCESDLVKPCVEGAGLTSVSQQVYNPLPKKTPNIFDLNAPFSLEDDINPKPSDVNQEIFVENREPEQVLVQLPKSDISHESNPPLSDISTSKPEVPLQKLALISTQRNSVHERPSGRIIVQALPCMKNCKKVGKRFIPTIAGLGSVKSVSECEDRENTEKSGGVDFNSDYSGDQQQTGNKPAVGLLFDLNSIASEEDEENESSPAAARMDSVENQAENEEDLVDLAGKAIVNISSSWLEKGIATSEPIDIQPLHWFANIVSDNHEEDSVPEGMDYFEAMTLQLKETKQEDFLPNRNVQKVEEPHPGPSQATKLQRKSARRQRKNFQKEILPNLASLSICEATEDLQTIGGLIKAANSGTSSKSAGKRMLTRGRKKSCLSSSSPDNNVVSKQQAGDSQKQRSVVDWGNIKRRRRSVRCPVNFQALFGESAFVRNSLLGVSEGI